LLSEAVWEATSTAPAWLTVKTNNGSDSIDLRESDGKYRVRLKLSFAVNEPQPGWAKVTVTAENNLREISNFWFRQAPSTVSIYDTLTVPETAFELSLTSSFQIPVLNPEVGNISVQITGQPPASLEDSASLELQSVFDPEPSNAGARLTLDHTELLRGDCLSYFRTTGMNEPVATKIVQPFDAGFREMQRHVWTLPESADSALRRTAGESVKKALTGDIKLVPGKEIRILSLPLPDGKEAAIFLGARKRSDLR
jgi:hypothetical protein